MRKEVYIPSWIVDAPSLFDSEVEDCNHPVEVVRKADFDAVARERDNFKKCYEIRMNNIIKIEADFASSVISNQEKDAEIQRLRDLLNKAKAYIDASPCDPDITAEQMNAWQEYKDALKELGEL